MVVVTVTVELWLILVDKFDISLGRIVQRLRLIVAELCGEFVKIAAITLEKWVIWLEWIIDWAKDYLVFYIEHKTEKWSKVKKKKLRMWSKLFILTQLCSSDVMGKK